MAREIPATAFKARCLELMDRVAEKRETYVVTKRGRAVARLTPVPRGARQELFGRLRHLAADVADITRPVLPAAEWNASTPPKRRARPRAK